MQSLMKFVLVALMAVMGATLAVPAHAQSGTTVKVEIPFDFSVGNTLLKAGSYRIEGLRSGILAFNGNEGQDHYFALTVGAEAANQGKHPKLVFARYGNEMFLSRIFLSGDNDYRQLLPSKREKNLIQKRTSGEELSLLALPVR